MSKSYRCPSCGGRAYAPSMCGKCKADVQRWRRLAESIRKGRDKAAKKAGRMAGGSQ